MPESSLIEQVEAQFVVKWGIFRPQFQDWPAQIKRTLQDLELWLEGESVVHLQLEHAVGDESFGFIEDATELSAFLLTDRFAVLVVIPREGGLFRPHVRYQVRRSALSDLETTLPQLRGLFEGLTFELAYDGLPRKIQIKLADLRSGQPDYEAEKSFFAMLRDDFYTNPTR